MKVSDWRDLHSWLGQETGHSARTRGYVRQNVDEGGGRLPNALGAGLPNALGAGLPTPPTPTVHAWLGQETGHSATWRA